jgi:hypothetical protein
MRPMRRIFVLTSGIAVLAGFMISPHRTFASASARAWVAPAVVKDGARVTVYGSNLRPKTSYQLLLAVPYLRKGAFERFFGLVKTDTHGSLKSTVTLPTSPACGSASVYLTPVRRQTTVRAIIKISCTPLKGGVPPPPPPPTGGKH